MVRIFCVAALLASACSDPSSSGASPADHGKPAAPPPGAVMRRLIEPARPCIERYRGQIEDPYFTQVRLIPKDGFIQLSFESGPHRDFNTCVSEAVSAARIPADHLDQPVVVPFAFSFHHG